MSKGLPVLVKIVQKVCLQKKICFSDDISWHFIGQLQTNKVKYIIDNVELIHSLDRLFAKELQKRAFGKNKLPCMPW